MGLFTTLAIGLGVASAGQSIAGGIAANKEAKYNASVMEQQAGMIDAQKGLEGYQYDRAKNQLFGKGVARTAKAGFELSGSPMAVMIDSLTQLEMDKSVGQYNLEVQKRFALSSADQYRRRGKTALASGYANAFSSILKAGFDAGMGSGMFKSGSISDPRGSVGGYTAYGRNQNTINRF